MKYLKKPFYYLLPFWKKEALILFLGIAGMLLGLVNPYLTKLIIDKAYGNRDLKLFIFLVIIGGIIFLFSELFKGLSNYLDRHIKLRLNFDLNRKVFKKLQNLPYGFFQDSSTGEHLYKISYDIEQFSRFIADVLPKAITLIPKSLFILIILFYLNWKIALFALGLMPFLYIVPLYFNRRLKRIFKLWIENSQGIFKRLQEVLSHIQLVKVFGKERQEIKKYISSLTQNIRFSLKNTRLEVTGSFANSLANRIILGLILFYGGLQIIKGQLTLGSLSAIAIYLAQLSGMQNSLAQFFQQITLGMISYERIEKILNTETEVTEEKDAREIIIPKGKIEFRNLSFGYQDKKMVLDKLSFTIEGGSCVGLAGYSGSGKTTIINLILRLYKPQNGEILIDGNRLSAIKAKSLYEQVGIVLQEPYLWNDTIENNIRYGKEGASFEELRWAAKVACIEDFINSLAQGYQTVIGENACKVSEGQKQRIAIARALIKKPKILILDETLSSVDLKIEARIIDNIREALKDSTIIVISHRLSTITRLDSIYFLENPQKVSIDTHQALLRKNSNYRDYLNQQLKEEKIALDIY